MAGNSDKQRRRAEVIRGLASQGLHPYRYEFRGGITFAGSLVVRGKSIQIELAIADYDFIYPPKIRLTDRDTALFGLRGHLNHEGDLCYLTEGQLLDPYNPVGSVLTCVDQAKRVIERVMNDDASAEETALEFPRYWELGASEKVSVLVATISEKSRRACSLDVVINGRTSIVIGDDSAALLCLAKQSGWAIPRPRALENVVVLNTDQRYHSRPEGLPKTISEVQDWFYRHDPAVATKIWKSMLDKALYRFTPWLFIVRTSLGWIGFFVSVERRFVDSLSRNPHKLIEALRRGKGKDTSIIRVAPTRIDDGYLLSRGHDLGTVLMGKRIVLIGAGAIGSYLAPALVRVGAGIGVRGKLRIIDPDEFQPENVGRHSLGLTDIFRNKAEAMRDAVIRSWPTADIEAVAKSHQEVGDLFSYDLIVDATGFEPASVILNHRHMDRLHGGQSSPPVIYTWVDAGGMAVRSLLVDSLKFGCRRCLRFPLASGSYLEERFPLSETPVDHRLIGCQSVLPFAVPAAMHAAALALDHAIALMSGRPSPRFRTRYVEGGDLRKWAPKDIEPHTRCPACRTA